MEDLAGEIIRRANKQGLSINKLCQAVGVSRRWFEYFKLRTPISVKTYVKMIDYLAELEAKKQQNQRTNGNNNHTGKEAGN